MPPLVDTPPAFYAPHPPISFSFYSPALPPAPLHFEMAPDPAPLECDPAFFAADQGAGAGAGVRMVEAGTGGGDGRTSHGKKRDASYIPRPPNAFILFRSSFIKSQQVPGKVEGNHSTLSKIIGASAPAYTYIYT